MCVCVCGGGVQKNEYSFRYEDFVHVTLHFWVFS